MSIESWWKAWGDLVWRLLSLFASFASLVGLLVYFMPADGDWSPWAVVLVITAIVFLVVLVFLEFRNRRGRRVYAKTDADGIRDYMHDLIEHGGRVAIWTRDMSWANNPVTRKLLTDKARRNELIVCLPQISAFAEELIDLGADVCAYGSDFLESPASRFTIAFFGRDGSRVAVGRAEGDSHVIDEFRAGDHPAFHLADDLITLVRSLKAKQNK